jgi:hypothetical protein
MEIEDQNKVTIGCHRTIKNNFPAQNNSRFSTFLLVSHHHKKRGKEKKEKLETTTD